LQHLIIDFFQTLVEAFVLIMHTIGADVYYSNIASPLELGKAALYITQPILADGVVVSLCLTHGSPLVTVDLAMLYTEQQKPLSWHSWLYHATNKCG
jgi:hypothetical protein